MTNSDSQYPWSPAPWRSLEGIYRNVYVNCSQPVRGTVCDVSTESLKTGRCNADLIALAPEMAEVILEMSLYVCKCDPNRREDISGCPIYEATGGLLCMSREIQMEEITERIITIIERYKEAK